MPIVNFTGNEITMLEKVLRLAVHNMNGDELKAADTNKEIHESAMYHELIVNCHAKVSHEIMYGTDGRGEINA